VGSPRIQQIDVVRALSVIAICFFHAVAFGFGMFKPPLDIAVIWQQIAYGTTGARLPVLFALSGYLTSARVRRGWRGAAGRQSAARVLTFFYIYAVWLSLSALLGAVVGGDRAGWTILSVQHFAQLLVEPVSHLWFIWALAAWSLLAPALARFDPRTVAVALLGLSVWTANIDTIYPTIAYYGLFHMLGVWAYPILSKHPTRIRPWALALAVAGVVGLHQVFLAVSPAWWTGGIRVARDLAGICAVIGVAGLLCRLLWAPAGLAWVGRRTLPIFILHYLIMSLTPRFPLVVDALSGVLLPVAPLIVTVVVILISIGIYEACLAMRAGWLFDLPRPLRAAVTREREPRGP